MMDEKIIWFIDNDERQLQQYQRHLEKAVGFTLGDDTDIVIRECLARPHKDNYLDILDNPHTITILIDQRLKDKGGVDHNGIDLAGYLRAINNILPIYILTNYPQGDEYSEGEWNVEDIIDKGDLIDSARSKVVISRVARRIDVFEKVYANREARFRELLKKSIGESLSEAEQQELDALEFERSASTIALDRLEEREPDKLDKVLDKLQNLRKMLENPELDDEE